MVLDRGVHTDFDEVRVAPTGRPWSMWVLFAEGTGEFAGWYVNLERPHICDDGIVYTSDHVLDLVIDCFLGIAVLRGLGGLPSC